MRINYDFMKKLWIYKEIMNLWRNDVVKILFNYEMFMQLWKFLWNYEFERNLCNVDAITTLPLKIKNVHEIKYLWNLKALKQLWNY